MTESTQSDHSSGAASLDILRQKWLEINAQRIDATDEELAAAEETEGHWFHILKVIFIVGKIAIVIVMMIIAAFMYRSKFQRWTLVPFLFALYIICLTGLIVIDLKTKYIAGYYIMILVCNYCSFLGFYKILTALPGRPGEQLWESTKWYFRTMNVLYAVTLGLSFIPRFGPYCTATKVYPACMNWASCLFIINFIFHCIMAWRKDYYFEEGQIVETEGEYQRAETVQHPTHQEMLNRSYNSTDSIKGAKERVTAGDQDDSLDESKLSASHWEQDEDRLAKRLFKKQMNVYLFFQGFLVLCNIAIQLWGRILVHNSGFLGCTEHGFQWLYTTITGEVFVATHMMLIITQGVMLEYALYKVPKKMGWFKVKSVQEADDDFKQPGAVITERLNESTDERQRLM